ncbi:Predicted nucleotide-binding protein, sugar kinase/HSP70/actin superfamily [Alteromonadaceae bacterium Bs31]|nr:Predicted nucleotide-binding protein, sugar kinase/HSP70/actin superfamily [Alteromonadaceae bacterium Bs31]
MQAPSPEEHTKDYLHSIDEQLKAFEREEAERLQIPQQNQQHWHDANPNSFTAEQREHTTILHAGLTMAHDLFIQSAFRGLGYKVEAMEVPDTRSLQFGREFGNRGQCNPTYFTVGNLIKKLNQLKAGGLSKKDIIENYLFATAGSCGPCRFGSYVTEYRKALRDAGFEGFRVILFQQAGGVKQATGEEMGLKIDAQFFITMCKAILLGDALNALGYRIRPYEINPGETDKVIAQAKQDIAKAFEKRKGLLKTLWKTRKALKAIQVDRTQIKPRVAIIGEFWAMTTEGDGNYKMHRFLEKEGAEVDIQLVTNWGLYLVWASRYDTKERAKLKGADSKLSDSNKSGSKFALQGVDVAKKLLQLRAAEGFLRGLFAFYARVLGLTDYHLPDMDHIAEISHRFYDNNLRGGEGHMEVGKMIHNVVDQKVNMTLSIKPFGCMPSSGVSDGVQSLITELYPAAIFLPIETNGDGAVNVYSRVQMQLFKAKQSAEKEVSALLKKINMDLAGFKAAEQEVPAFSKALYRSRHHGACTALDLAEDLYHRQQRFDVRIARNIKRWIASAKAQHQKQTLLAVERAAKRYKESKNSGFGEMAVRIMEP